MASHSDPPHGRGRGGSVASGHPQVTEAAAQMLRSGGNAFDAAVAAGFASAVVEPTLTSLGGGGFLLAHRNDGEAILFDFFVDTPGFERPESASTDFFPIEVTFPSSVQTFHVGMGSAAVPGSLRGLLHVHERLGRLTLAEVVAPAVRLARDGVSVDAFQASTMTMLAPILTLTERSRALFAPAGRLLRAGDPWVNRDLASFLERLPDEGDAALYGGELNERIAAEMAEGGGLLGGEDLSRYRVHERTPLELPYRGRTLLTNPTPSFGGPLIALSLRLIEPLEPLPFGTPLERLRLAEALGEVVRLRDAGILRRDDAPDGVGLDRMLLESIRWTPKASRGTTHLSVIDGEGNAAAMTTSNGEGSGYIVPGTGIMLNNMLGEDDLHPQGFHATPPGVRVASMMAPSVLVGDDGRIELALGSGGSKRIRTAIFQVLVNVVDHGMSLADAVAAPRLHLDAVSLEVEPGLSEEALAELAGEFALNRWSEKNMYFGGVHAVTPTEAVGDARRGGSARVLEQGS